MVVESTVYLSVSGLVGGGGAGLVGEGVGLVSLGAPFRRLALTSAILRGHTANPHLVFVEPTKHE